MLVVVRPRHPLLNVFPLAVMALAILLVSFAFAMAAAGDSHDADLSAVAGVGVLHSAPGQAR